MRIRSVTAVAAMVLAGLSCSRPAAQAGMRAEAAAAPRTVFLGTFGRTTDGLEARDQMREELRRVGRFEVVDAEAGADAVLMGEVVLRRPSSGRLGDIRAFGDLRLMRAGSNQVLWRHIYDPRDVEPPSNSTTPTEWIHRVVVQLSEQLHRDVPGR